MNIPEYIEKFKRFVVGDFFFLAVLVLVASISFTLGYLAAKDGSDEVFIDTSAAVIDAGGREEERNFVASQSGSKYYLPWCSGVNRIKEENKVWFATVEDAVLSGYEPAANCPGI